MDRWLVISVALSISVVTPCAAETMEAESKIVAVTVFPDRASITRAAALKLSQGSHTVMLGSLPSRLEPDSVTVRGAGEAKVTLYGVRVVTQQLETAQNPKVKALEEEIHKVTGRQQELRNTKQVLEQERKYLTSIQAASSQQIGKDLVTKSPNAADAAALLAFLDESLLKNFDREQEADVKLEELGRQLDKLQRELASLTQGESKQETAVAVDLEAHEDTSFQLEVSYRVPAATWQPTYEARAATASDQVELALHGVIRQQTGEDWNDVRLTLSTAKPALSGSMPELQPWYLKPWEPIAAQKTAMAARAHGGLALNEADREEAAFKGDRGLGSPPPEEAKVAMAVVETQGPSVTFVLPKSESIPSDWQPHKVPIGVQSLKASLAYETTPRLVPYAFLRARVTNTTDGLYLAGPIAVFLNDAFVATSALKQIAPSEEFDLFLGADERVKVERKTLKEHVEVSLLPGLRGKSKSTDYDFLTTIQNFTGRRITVTVFDQVPVSQREEIVVESVKQTPAEIVKDDEKPGVFRWVLELANNQKQELKLSYRVRHPVDLQIQ